MQGDITSTAAAIDDVGAPPCLIMDALYPERQAEWRPIPERNAGSPNQLANVPLGVFSFHDAPNRALNALRRVAIFD